MSHKERKSCERPCKILKTLTASYFACNTSRIIFCLVQAAAMLFTAPTMASAEEPVDMSKLSCKEFLSADQSKIGMMLMWIDGYMSGKSDNTMMDNAWMEKLGTHMGKYCASNPQKTIMDAIENMPE